MRFDQYAGHCIILNFRRHSDSHSQILTIAETPSVSTSARFNLICLSSLDWLSWLLLPAASALSCHLLVDDRVSLHIADWHLWKLCRPVFYRWSSFASYIHDTCYSQTRILNYATSTLLIFYSSVCSLPPSFTFNFWQRVRTPSGW